MNKTFRAFFATVFISAFNDNVFKNALVVLIAYRGRAAWGLDGGSVVALAGGLFMLPFFVFSAWAGRLADRVNKGRLIRTTKAVEIVIMGVAALGFWRDDFDLLLVTLFFAGAQAAVFGPVKYAVISELVGTGQLIRANAIVEAGTFFAILAGTVLGGALATADRGGPLALSLVVIAALGWTVSLGVKTRDVATEERSVDRSLWRTLRQDRLIFYAVLLTSWFWFTGAATLSILPALGRESLNVEASVVTFFLGLFTVGIGLGSLIGERASRGAWSRYVVPGGAAATSVACLALAGALRSFPRPEVPMPLGDFVGTAAGLGLAIAFVAMATAAGSFVLPLLALAQRRAPARERSRVIAANNVMNAVFMVLASFGVLGARVVGIGHAGVFALIALLNAGVCGAVLTREPDLSLDP